MYKYDYSKFIKLPEHGNQIYLTGEQIMHFLTVNKPVIDHQPSHDYIQSHMGDAQMFKSDASILKYAVEQARINEGLFLEFGVGIGKTTNFIAALNPNKIIHGFDSFQGLPEDWIAKLPKGTFALLTEQLPMLLDNIYLHIGMFDEQLPKFIDQFMLNQKIAFIHIDCDLYSSTKTIFQYLGGYISSGTIIHFDEYFNYEDWQEHEYRAFKEFVWDNNLQYDYIAYNSEHMQVTIRIR